MKKELCDELGITPDGLLYAGGRLEFNQQTPENVDTLTALTVGTTYYSFIGRMPCGGTAEKVVIRGAAQGAAGGTIDILKVPSGTAITAGTAIVTQINNNAITADTDYEMSVLAAAKTLNAGDLLVSKIVTAGGADGLKPLNVNVVVKV